MTYQVTVAPAALLRRAAALMQRRVALRALPVWVLSHKLQTAVQAAQQGAGRS